MDIFAKDRWVILHKVLCFLMVSVFCLSAVMTGTYGWSGLVSALNEFLGSAEITTEHDVVLEKYALDLEGELTDAMVPHAGFGLYLRDEGEAEETWIWIENPDSEDGYYYTDENGQIHISGLNPGSYKFVEWVVPYGYEETEAEAAEYLFEITEKSGSVVVKAYNQVLATKLELMKTVVNADGTDLTREQLAKEFTFEVSFSDGNLYRYYKDDDEENLMDLVVTDADTGTLTLKHGETATFTEVPVGVVVTVWEQLETGYRAMSQSHQISAMLPDEDGKYQRTEFVNTYEMDSLVIDKMIRGSDAAETDDFIFTITFSDGGAYDYVKRDREGKTVAEGSLESGAEFTLKGGESIEFKNLPAGLEYVVKEREHEEYVTVSAQEYEGVIFYPDDEYDGGRNEVHFMNSMPEEDCGSLEIGKTILNYTEELKDDEFEFRVEFSDGGSYEYYYTDDVDMLYLLDSGGSVFLKHGQSVVLINIPDGVFYSVTELRPDGYEQAFTDKSGFIRNDYQSEEWFSNRFIDEEEAEEGGFMLTKHIDGLGETDGAEHTAEFLFTIKFYDADGYEVSADEKFLYRIGETEMELSSGQTIALRQGETAEFYGIPEGCTYQITEAEHDGYIRTKDTVSGVIIGGWSLETVYNNLTDEAGIPGSDILAELTIKKSTYGTGADSEHGFDFQIEFDDGGRYQYYRNGSEDVIFELPEDGIITLKHGEYITFTDVPEGTGYSVTELDNEYGYQADVRVMSGTVSQLSEELHFRNYRAAPVVLVVEKVVENGPAVKDKFTFIVTINGESETFTLEDGESREFTVYPGDEYEVLEEDPYRYGYLQKAITNGSGTVGNHITKIEVVKTNTYTPSIIERTGVSVEKKWIHGSAAAHPESVYVQLYRDGEAYGPAMKLSEANGWWHTWVGLDKAYTWTVDEEKVPAGYEKHITGNAGSGFVITNVHESDDGTGGTTASPGGDQNKTKDPGGTDKSDDGSGDGGSATEDGAGTQNGGDAAGGPKTGDATEFWFWSLLLIASALALRHILFGEDKRSRLQ